MRQPILVLALLCTASAAPAATRPLRDPFARPAPPPPAATVAAEIPEPPPLRLRAIILNGARSVANIDGMIVGTGERAGDAEVVRIDARGVLVSRGGKRQWLLLNEKDKQ